MKYEAFVVIAGLMASVASADNVLFNAGFEQDLLGWTTDYADIRMSSPPPYCGAKYLVGSHQNKSLSYTSQTVGIDALGFDAGEVDDEGAVVEYGGWQAGYQGQTDRGKIELIFRDEAGEAISSVDLGWFYTQMVWELRSGVETLPAGTRSVTYGFYAQRFQGSNNDAYLDNAFLAALPGCYADFTGDGTLDLFDFLAFVNAFNAGDEAADCAKGCGELNLFDFLCLTNRFNEGC